MSDIIKPLMLDETGKAIVEALTQKEMTQTRIAEIDEAADTAKAAIEAKTDEQVARIPEVTELASDVSRLKDDLDDSINGLSAKEKEIFIEWENGYITPAGVEGASNTAARSKNVLHFKPSDIVRYNSEGYKALNVFLYNSEGVFTEHKNFISIFGAYNTDITLTEDIYCRFSSGLISDNVITNPTEEMANVFTWKQSYNYKRIDDLETEIDKLKDNPQRIENLESNIEKLNAKTIIVAQDGSGDFTTIQEAVDFAEDNDTILVMPGVYEEMVTTKIDVAPWQKYVHIKGYDKYRCILQTHTNERLLEPLTMSIGSVSNMTIKNLYDESQPHDGRGGYCIHVDINGHTDVSRLKIVLDNCIFYSENGDCLGCGLTNDGWIFEVRNCLLESAEIAPGRCFAIHNTMSESSGDVILENNRMIKHGECTRGKLVSFTDVRNGQDYNSIIEVYAHNNTVYDFYNDTSDSVYVGTPSAEKGWDNQTQFILSKDSFGNNTALLN